MDSTGSKPEGEGWTAKTLRCMCEKNTALCMDIEGMLTRVGFKIAETNYHTPTYAGIYASNAHNTPLHRTAD